MEKSSFTSANVNGNDVYIGTDGSRHDTFRSQQHKFQSLSLMDLLETELSQFQHRLMSFGWLR
jgi:hypothetical protein